MTQSAKTHWDTVYRTKPHDAVSWYRAHLDHSLELVRRSAGDRSSAIIDVGGGESTLVDDLLAVARRHDFARAFERLAENPLEGFTVSSPAAASGQLFLRTREALHCIGRGSP